MDANFLPILANLNGADSEFGWNWLLVLGGCLWLVDIGFRVVDRFLRPNKSESRTIDGQPIKVVEVEKLVTKEELRLATEEIDKDIRRLSDAIEKQDDRIEKTVANIHEKINAVSNSAQRIAGTVEQIERNLRLFLEKEIKR